MNNKKNISLLFVLILLGGCSNVPVNQSPVYVMSAPNTLQHKQLIDLMRYYEQLQKKTGEQLAKEYSDVRERFLANQNDENRARYTSLLSLPDTSFHNTTSALQLLNEWSQKTELSTETNSLKNLLVLLLKKQQHLDTKIRDLSQKLNDERMRSEALQKQVDDIKDMEKSLFRGIAN